jgi:hypothetical protein
MKKRMKKEKTKEEIKRGFVWWALRISCCLPIVPFILAGTFFDKYQNLLYYFLMFTLLLIISFSIINLIKYKKKEFAIVSLVLSAIFFLTFSLWLIVRTLFI